MTVKKISDLQDLAIGKKKKKTQSEEKEELQGSVGHIKIIK